MSRLFVLVFTFLICAFFVNGQEKTQPIKLDFFNKIPSQIDGCSGLYTYDTASLKKKRYIIVTDLQEMAFIRLEGRQIILKRTSNTELSRNSHRTVYKGNGYTVILTTKTVKQSGDEVWIESGYVEILQGKNKVIIKIHGEAGC